MQGIGISVKKGERYPSVPQELVNYIREPKAWYQEILEDLAIAVSSRYRDVVYERRRVPDDASSDTVDRIFIQTL